MRFHKELSHIHTARRTAPYCFNWLHGIQRQYSHRKQWSAIWRGIARKIRLESDQSVQMQRRTAPNGPALRSLCKACALWMLITAYVMTLRTLQLIECVKTRISVAFDIKSVYGREKKEGMAGGRRRTWFTRSKRFVRYTVLTFCKCKSKQT